MVTRLPDVDTEQALRVALASFHMTPAFGTTSPPYPLSGSAHPTTFAFSFRAQSAPQSPITTTGGCGTAALRAIVARSRRSP